MFIRNIHDYMHHVSGIETAIVKRHLQRAALLQGNPIAQTNPVAQNLSGFDKLRRQVDATYPAAEAASREPGPAAQTTAHIQHVGPII